MKRVDRDPRDFYQTPEWCVHALLKTLRMPTPTFDPCAGNGALLAAVQSYHAHRCHITGVELDSDLAERAVELGLPVRQGDGLARDWKGEHVLMNPPFKTALTWVQKAVDEATSCAALVRLDFLVSMKRLPFWKKHAPSAVLLLSRRPSFKSDGSTDNSGYCWLYWGPYPSGMTALRWMAE